MEYLRLDPLIDTDPGLEEAGWCASRVYELLLKVSAQYDLKGRIPAERQSSTWLAKRWNLAAEDLPGVRPADFIANGIARLIDAGKLVQDGNAWVIRGWEKFYKPARTPAERKQDQRERDETEGASRNVTPVTNVTTERDSRDCHATPLHTTPLHFTEKEAPARANEKAALPQEPKPLPSSKESGPVGELRDGIDAAFLEARGTAYDWTSQDENALRSKTKHGTAEILRRWRIGLRRTRFPLCNSVVDLAKHWNAYAADEPQANGNGPPSREHTTGKGVAGVCESCGSEGDVAAFGGKRLCYPCAAALETQDGTEAA